MSGGRHDRDDSSKKKGKSGNDTLFGGEGNDHLDGDRGNDVLFGHGGNDQLHGGEGDDTLYGGSGRDKLDGGQGNDLLVAGEDSDELDGGSGEDTLYGDSGHDELDGGSGNDLLVASDGSDKLEGNSGNDTLDGGSGIDCLDGGSGNDRLTGGTGADLIDGGSGFDTAVYSGAATDYQIHDLFRDTVIVRDMRGGSPDGIDLLHDVEALQFSDRIVYIDGRNNAPVAGTDELTTAEDQQLVIPLSTLLANDVDFDGDRLKITAVGNSVNGTVTLVGKNVVFTPNADFSGEATFTYTLSDGHGGTAQGLVKVDVEAAGNRPPVAVADAFEGDEEETITGNVLDNDTDPDEGDTLMVTTVGTFATTNGSVTIAANGDFTYTPDPNFFGEDSFDYTVRDAAGEESTASVTLTVNPVNDLPVAVGDSATLDEDTPSITGDVLANDTDVEDPESLSILNAGTYETALGILDLHEDGTYVYTLKDAAQALAAGAERVESHLYVIGDAEGDLASNFLTITITGSNDAPAAEDDAYLTDEDVPLEIGIAGLLANDADVDDGDFIEFVSVQDAVNGTVEIDGDQVIFTPDADFTGDAEFSYTIRDADGETDTATASVRVRSEDDVLGATDDGIFTLDEDVEFFIPAASLLANDSGLGISVVSLDDPVNGFVEFVDDQVHFIPDFGFSGEASFTYTIEDTTGAQATATVTLDYDPVADFPVVFANDAAAAPGVFIPLFLEANLDDVDGSETLEIRLTDVFEGASFFQLTGDGLVAVGDDQGGGTWEFTQEELAGLHIFNLPLGPSTMTLEGIATETETGESATSTATFQVLVGAPIPGPDGEIIFS
jgi:VCBS repeat-containing protein